MRRFILGLFLAAAVVSPVNAQFLDRLTNPQVTVTLTHPPYLGLKIDRIAFGPSQGQCADEFMDAVVADFHNSGMEVLNRQHLEELLAEHHFQLSSHVDKTTAVALGKILGPSALVFLKVHRCATEKKSLHRDWTDFAGKAHRTYISKVEAYFKGSLQTVDLATARIFTAQTIEASESQQTEAEGGLPEPPSEYEVLDQAQRAALERVHRMFLPWTETRKLYFFDDKECGLKTAFLLLRGGDLEGTLRLSEANLEECKAKPGVKPKVLVHAHYNVGMANFALSRHEAALGYFAEAARMGGGNIVAETMSECRRAQQLAAEMQRLEDSATIEAVAAAPPRGAPGAKRASQPAAGSAGTAQASRSAAPPAAPPDDIETRLKKLDELLKKGLITKQEYDRKRAAILGEL
jgi:hypothetical protein